jgi:hypothetical protein
LKFGNDKHYRVYNVPDNSPAKASIIPKAQKPRFQKKKKKRIPYQLLDTIGGFT